MSKFLFLKSAVLLLAVVYSSDIVHVSGVGCLICCVLIVAGSAAFGEKNRNEFLSVVVTAENTVFDCESVTRATRRDRATSPTFKVLHLCLHSNVAKIDTGMGESENGDPRGGRYSVPLATYRVMMVTCFGK